MRNCENASGRLPSGRPCDRTTAVNEQAEPAVGVPAAGGVITTLNSGPSVRPAVAVIVTLSDTSSLAALSTAAAPLAVMPHAALAVAGSNVNRTTVWTSLRVSGGAAGVRAGN